MSSFDTRFKKGQTPWNKELTKEIDERVKKIGDNIQRNIKISLKMKGNKINLGKKYSEEHKKNISLGLKKCYNENKRVPWNKGKKCPQCAWNKGLTKKTDSRLAKSGNRLKGRKAWNKGLTKEDPRVKKYTDKLIGRKASEETRQKLRLCSRQATSKHYEKILELKKEMEQQGFRCIPIGKVVPDIIALKDNKVFAVELEYQKPNYNKYTDDIKHFFDDIIWVIKRRK